MPVRLDRKRRIIERLEHHGTYSGAVLAAFKVRDLHLCPACGSETVVQEEGRTHDDVTLRCGCGWDVTCKPSELRQAPRAGHALVDACAAVALQETRREVALEAIREGIREGVRRPGPRPRAEPAEAREKPPTPLERRGKQQPRRTVPVSAAAASVAGRSKDETVGDTAGTEAPEGADAGAGEGARRPKRRGQDRVRDARRQGGGGMGETSKRDG